MTHDTILVNTLSSDTCLDASCYSITFLPLYWGIKDLQTHTDIHSGIHLAIHSSSTVRKKVPTTSTHARKHASKQTSKASTTRPSAHPPIRPHTHLTLSVVHIITDPSKFVQRGALYLTCTTQARCSTSSAIHPLHTCTFKRRALTSQSEEIKRNNLHLQFCKDLV
jgi:hypothetical protein